MKKRKPTFAERKDGTQIQRLANKEYEARFQEKTGADGIPETHISFHPGKGTITHLPENLRCRNVMSNKDRRRLGLEPDNA